MSAFAVLPFSEIASRLGCTTAEARSAYKNGMRKIRTTRTLQAKALARKVEEFRALTTDPYKITT